MPPSPGPCWKAARPTHSGAASASPLHSTVPPQKAPRSAPPGSPAPPESNRTFIYRHRDLLEKIHAFQAEPPSGDDTGPAVTRASLQADLLAAHERAIRLSTRIHHLEKRLSEALGDQAWRESGLGAPADIDALTQKITHLEQQVLDLKLQLEERDEDLAAARAASRELMTQLNHPGRPQ